MYTLKHNHQVFSNFFFVRENLGEECYISLSPRHAIKLKSHKIFKVVWFSF